MLYTRNAFHFRKYFKEKIARERGRIDLNFVGSLHPDKRRNETGFSKLIYGNREDLGKFLGTIALNVAADDQAIYELIQNADDCKSSFFSVNYNEKYLLCINNGNYFSDDDMSAIINVAGNYKDGEDIGTFGIGFKILHRLVGADDGREAIINDYAGPIIFSWKNYFQLKKFIDGEPIFVSGIGKAKENYNYERDRENPWLIKILYTCFPSNYKEPIRLGDYDTRDVKFDEKELAEMREFLTSSLQNVNLSEDNYLKNGSIFFLRLGEGKSKFLDEGIDKIKSGLSYSFKFLNNLNKIYINGNEIKAKSVLDYSHSFPINSQEFIDINPKNKKRDIKFTFAFYRDYKKAVDLQNELAPNLYTFFSMDEEKNGFSFLLHCNAFDMNNDRRKLQANSQINEKLLPIIAKSIISYANIQKENNRNLFFSLYSNFLLSKIPKNKPHIDNNFFKFIHQYILENIPTKNGFSDKPENVKINKLKLNLNLAEFGLNDIQWFKWDNEADKLLIEEAKKAEKLGIEEWDIRNIIEKANLESINKWISTCDSKTYRAFLKELEESYLRKETKEKICQIKLFKFSNGKFYSFYEIVKKQIIQNRTIVNYGVPYVFFKTPKTEGIVEELDKIGIILSEISTSEYPNIFSSIEIMPDEKQMYTFIADKCKTNTLTAKEKKKLFLNFINEATKFNNVGESTLKDLQLFCNNNSEIKPLKELIGKIQLPSWLSAHKIKQDEFFPELNPYLISKSKDIFKNIYQQNQDDIIAKLTTAEEIKSLIKLYQDNKKSFFKEFIIRKENNGFAIEKKDKTFQVQSADKKTRKFLNENCSDNLFVLPFEFVEEYKDEDGIIKADDLHSLILKFVDADKHKETLVDIVKYKAKHKFLQKLSEFRFISDRQYTKEDYEYKILDLACSELKEDDYQKFKAKVVIETENQDLKLSEIPPFTEKIKIDDYEISLAKILPDNYGNSDHLSSLINQFIGLGLNKERIRNLFGISEEPEPITIFQIFSEQVTTVENAEQLAFLILIAKNNSVDIEKFKVETLDDKERELKYNYYVKPFSFIGEDYLLKQQYSDISELLKLPVNIGNTDNRILLEPYFKDEKFICPCLKTDLSEEQKLSFVEFLFNQWNRKSKKTAIKNIDWRKIDDVETENILGFNPTISVYPSKYACKSEVLPDYVIKWIGKEESKIDFLSDLGVWTENSVVVELRKYLSGKIKDFHNNRLAQEKRFNEDETNLINSFVWLKENEITLKTAEQFETFKKVVYVINENRTNIGDLKIKEEFDFEELEENATEWEESYYENWKEDSDVAVFLYKGELPKTISLDAIEDFVFYNFYEGNIAIDDTNNIYVNRNADVKKELRKLELENEDFNFDRLWQNKLEVLEKENTKLRIVNEAILGTEFSTDISKNDQIEANREAKEIVKEKLEREGFEFTKGIGKKSTIDGVFKDDIEYPLVVKSYKYQDEPLKIAANEWIQLMKPNSMFWLHFGNRKLGCLKLYELLRNQDKLTLSFSTENLDVEDRLQKFAELLRYFSNVHFNFNSIKPSDYSISKDLSDYRFDERRNEEDLSGDDESIL